MYYKIRTIRNILIFIILSINICVRASSVVLKDNGYEGVVLAIEEKIPVEDCQAILLGLQDLMTSSSEIIFRTTRNRASFRKINILVPSSWTPSQCPLLQGKLREASSESWNHADVRITSGRHPDFGARPWVLQTKGCAQQGDYISMGHEILFRNESNINGRMLVHAWLRYRYGVFEEIGIESSTTHPTTHRSANGQWVPTACANVPLRLDRECDLGASSCASTLAPLQEQERITGSFMAFPDLDSVTELCDEGTHNSAAPTPHNLICGSKSVWEVLRASQDFQNNRNVEGPSVAPNIEFTYVQPKKPRLILLVEDTNIMNVQKRWDFMRKAVRKLVMYDIPENFNVGLVVFDSEATTKYPLNPMTDNAARDNLGSSLPRNPSRVDKHRRCVVCGIKESIKLLRETGGTSGGHIVLLLAGSSHVDARELHMIERILQDTNIVLHVTVYPLTEKYPEPGNGIEIIGAGTGGLTFTVQDDGIGADSKIAMYYNLLDSLYQTLSVAAGENALPIKVHSAEHKGGLLQNSEGSFWVDPGLGSDTVFAVFYYDLAHVGDEIHLISPQGQVIDTGNMQRENDNTNMITVRLRKNQEAHGLWHYKLENRADSHQALFVQVTSRPRAVFDGQSVKVRSWTNQMNNQVNLTDISNTLIVFTEVRVGLASVEEAKITAVLTRLGLTSNGTEYAPSEITLQDNGLLSPDIKQGDGVYSRYITELNAGKYTAEVMVEGRLGQHKFTRHIRLGIFDVIGTRPVNDVTPPSRITNLRAVVLPDTDGQISFAWTAPGDDFDYGISNSYKVLVNENLQALQDETGDILEGWPFPLPSHSIQQHTITWKNFDKLYYLGMFAVDEAGNAAMLSNIVELFVPSPVTPAPSVVTVPSSDIEEQLHTAGSTVFGGFGTKQMVVIFGCLAGFLLIIFIVICYCTTFHRKNKKKATKNDEPKDTFNVTVTVGNPDKQDGIIKKDYLRPINSWSPSELLGHDKRESLSDNNSDHSGSTKKSCAGSSDPPQYYSNGVQFSYEGNSYNDAYALQTNVYPDQQIENYSQGISTYPGVHEPYVVEPYPAFAGSHNSDSFLSDSCDMVPGSQGPPGYSPYSPYDMRGVKIPPPIPPKPKVHYAPEPYIYDGNEPSGRNSSSASVSSEKRIRNVTMV